MKISTKRNPTTFCAFLFLSSLFLSVVSAQSNNNTTYSPPDEILLNCGASRDVPDTDGRQWNGDVGSGFAPSSQNTLTSRANSQAPSVTEVPYMTARIFRSEFTYSFPVGAGRKAVRLHFYPSSYDNLNASAALFSVTSGPYTLLSNFSAYLSAQSLNFDYVVEEFAINVTGGFLNLTLTPTKSVPNAYAFVNGIEVVSIPNNIFGNEDAPLVGAPNQLFPVQDNTVLQNLYRLNVGGRYIPPTNDPIRSRSWDDDSPYIYGAGFGITNIKDPNFTINFPDIPSHYIAPEEVYSTARSMTVDPNINKNSNLTWILAVYSNYTYMVRLHFCEFMSQYTKINQRVFEIYINNQTATDEADVIAWTGNQGNGIPVYKDYIVTIPTTSEPFSDLWIALHPKIGSSQYYDAILNGLEVFKLNNTEGSLGGPNPIPKPVPQGDGADVHQKSGPKSHTAVIVGSVVGSIAVVAILGLIIAICQCQRKDKDSSSSDGPSGWLPLSLYGNSHSAGSAKTGTTGSYASSLPANLCRHFSFAEITAATNDFDEALLLGVGGFGKVYRGEIDGGTTKVAIKRGNPLSEQGVHEFQTEIEMLSKLRHRHLVSLIGYCEENCEMILVYDYMAHGTLREHLYKTQKPPLTWRQRLEICIGAARGLHYLHTGAKHTIIHRDVKTTNILLDEKWVAKVSDFGLSKTGPTLDHTHVSTVVKGSFGYLDPEYFRRQQLTEKSDVYSFGVVLFEVLCARPALNPALPKEQVSLAEWALHCQKKGILDQIIDPFLKGKIAPECFKKFGETAEKCVADQGIDRPAMGDVLWNLEFALQLQESADETGTMKTDTDNEVTPFTSSGKKDLDVVYGGNISDSRSTMSIGGRSLTSEDSDGLTPSAVFSQIMNPKGR
ncbi:receptor-like protein kinase FERONIA [Aristolochia californica]|uniref:receptor-like protein kinase FERONIA n=1 Tax=Aristolochia californica TaxID=171875 RepID=UPI0035D68FF4